MSTHTIVPANWTASQIPNLAGSNVIVTGANSGIGFHTALELGRAGARVVLACRDPQRGQEALDRLKREAPAGAFSFEALDLASLASVRAFADRVGGQRLDLLVNNAGVMAVPKRELTVDGFERQLGTNHLGHFALTGLLMPALGQSVAPRVVTVSSGLAMFGKIALDNLQGEKSYSPNSAYARAKLANLLFMHELGRRAPWLISVSSHPGATYSNLQQYRQSWFDRLTMKLLAQTADQGALPSLYAAVAPLQSGDYFGPSRRMGMQGPPRWQKQPKRAHDVETARALWAASEQLTHVQYQFTRSSAPESLRPTAIGRCGE